uniref:Zinc finger PHD-type domain-containing protein n=1 Tax=Cacopsylla melanoneura TaxID=428564 RepID=A0A8D9E8D1_9HEMI
MSCSKCQDVLAEKDKLVCFGCGSTNHYKCVGVIACNFAKMDREKKRGWKCPTCKDAEKKEEGNQGNNFETSFKKFSGEITVKIDGFGEKMAAFENSIEFNSSQLLDIITKLDDLTKKYDEVLRKQEALEKENDQLKKINKSLEEKQDANENRSRLENIEIREFPETRGEDVVNIVTIIGRAIGVENINEGDIQVAHRVDLMNKDRGGKHRPIIVHMGSRYIRNKWLQKYRDFRRAKSSGKLGAKDISNSLPDSAVYLNEHITVKRKLLLKEAKTFAREKNIKFVWVKDGFILMKKNENDHRVQKISTADELEKYKRNF